MSNQRKSLGSGLESRVVQKLAKAGIPSKKQPLSGILKDYKGDVIIPEIALLECKVRSTQIDAKGAEFFRVDTRHLSKIREEAKQMGVPMGILVFNVKGSSKPLVVLDFDEYVNLLISKDTYNGTSSNIPE